MNSKSTSIPRFSVVTATYNRADFLPACIESLLRQSFSSWELLIADDGSTDNTAAVVREYSARDPRVRYVHQENRGANAARNLGCRSAIGEYVLILDDDDEARGNWLAELDELAAESRAEVVSCGVQEFSRDGRLLKTIKPVVNREGSSEGGVYASGTYAVRRDVFWEVGGMLEGLPAHQSTEFRMRLFAVCKARDYRIVATDQCLIKGLFHEQASIRKNPRAKLDATQYILDNHRDKFKSRQSVASWLASAGGCAAELGLYRDAREYFGKAAREWPSNWKNYCRYGVCWIPGLRRFFWRATGKPRSQ
jgi:glycosyltransferase involved in cell wall biosynthesis